MQFYRELKGKKNNKQKNTSFSVQLMHIDTHLNKPQDILINVGYRHAVPSTTASKHGKWMELGKLLVFELLN